MELDQSSSPGNRVARCRLRRRSGTRCGCGATPGLSDIAAPDPANTGALRKLDSGRRWQGCLLEVEAVGHVVGGGVAGVERGDAEGDFAEFDDADVGVKGLRDSLFGKGTDHETWHTRTIAELTPGVGWPRGRSAALPGVLLRRVDVVVPAAPIVPSDENGGLRPVLALRDQRDPACRPFHPLFDRGRRVFTEFDRMTGSVEPGNIRQGAGGNVGIELCGEADVRTAFERGDFVEIIVSRTVAAPGQADLGETGGERRQVERRLGLIWPARAGVVD